MTVLIVLILLILPLVLSLLVPTAVGRRLRRSKELWKSYALALEVSGDCQYEYDEKVAGEGCRKRMRRQEAIMEQWLNVDEAADKALDELVEAGEYDDCG